MEIINNKNIILIGPGCVGKSLISEELSRQTGYPLVSIDDIFSFVGLEMEGLLSNDKLIIDYYKKAVSQAYDEDYRFALGEGDIKLKKKRADMIKAYVKDYKKYIKMFGGLQQFYHICNIRNRFHNIIDQLSPNVAVWMEKLFYIQCIEIIQSNIETPVIIDAPGFYGFKQNKLTNKEINELMKYGFNVAGIDLEGQVKQQLKQLGYTVFLDPGIDYKQRRAIDTKKETADMLANNSNKYIDYADFMISVNGLFYDPKDVSLKSRYYFDVKSQDRREQIKNNSELKNIAYSILQGILKCDNIIM